ncbi:MAG: UPF0147 family protein [Candidatus Woesearchaeota archaeon]
MDVEEQIKIIIDVLGDLQEEGSVPRNVKDKIVITIEALKEKDEISIKVHKALHELEEVAEDPNLQTYTRTQIWNVVSELEKIA